MNLRHHSVVLFSCLWLGLLGGLCGAEPAVARRPQPDRWLLIVDTSAAMERRSQAVAGVVGELIVSGMNGQMHVADELGIWTFNNQLYAGVMPLQNWQPARSNAIAGRSSQFIGQQVYQHKADLTAPLTALGDVLRNSRKLTVVLISDGAGKITGTPFDQAINEAYARHAAVLGKSRMPLVTVLRGHQGAWIGQSVSIAPWPVEFPPFPTEPDGAQPAPLAVEPGKPVPPAQSIFISGGNAKAESAKVLEGPSSAPIVPAQPQPLTVTEPQPMPMVAPVEINKPVQPVAVTAPPLALRPLEPAAPDPVIKQTPANPPAMPAPSTPTPALTAVAPAVAVAMPDTATTRKWPLVFGIILMWVAILVALALARRTRRAQATSLITRSLDPHAKSDGPQP